MQVCDSTLLKERVQIQRCLDGQWNVLQLTMAAHLLKRAAAEHSRLRRRTFQL